MQALSFLKWIITILSPLNEQTVLVKFNITRLLEYLYLKNPNAILLNSPKCEKQFCLNSKLFITMPITSLFFFLNLCLFHFFFLFREKLSFFICKKGKYFLESRQALTGIIVARYGFISLSFSAVLPRINFHVNYNGNCLLVTSYTCDFVLSEESKDNS